MLHPYIKEHFDEEIMREVIYNNTVEFSNRAYFWDFLAYQSLKKYWKNGWYEGEAMTPIVWGDPVPQGRGICYSRYDDSDQLCVGLFKDNKKNGLTYCVISANSIFIGNLVDDVRQGYGYLQYPNG